MFYDNYKYLCKMHGESEFNLAVEQFHMSHNALSKWKKGAKPQARNLKQIADYFKVTPEWLISDHNSEAAPIAPPESEFKLPVYGAISAGRGVLAQEDIIDYEYTDSRYNDGAHVWLEVRGISMEPELHSGDRVLIRRQPELESDQLGAFIVGDEGFIKRYRKCSDGVHLVSQNSIYPDMIFAGKDLNRLTIIGKVIEARHKY